MELLTLTEIRRRAQNGAMEARVHVQVEAAAGDTTRDGKPYCKLTLADAADRMTLRVWNDHPDYKACDSLQPADFIELAGEFQQSPQFGLEARNWRQRALSPDEVVELLQGPPELRAKQAADWALHDRMRGGDRRSAAACAERSVHARIGANAFAARPARGVIITRDAEGSSSTPRR